MLRVFGLWLVMTVAAVGSAAAQSGDIDPVGTYEFTTVSNNQTVTGTITISKTETGWSALLESPSGQLPPLTTTSLKVDLVVIFWRVVQAMIQHPMRMKVELLMLTWSPARQRMNYIPILCRVLKTSTAQATTIP